MVPLNHGISRQPWASLACECLRCISWPHPVLLLLLASSSSTRQELVSIDGSSLHRIVAIIIIDDAPVPDLDSVLIRLPSQHLDSCLILDLLGLDA